MFPDPPITKEEKQQRRIFKKHFQDSGPWPDSWHVSEDFIHWSSDVPVQFLDLWNTFFMIHKYLSIMDIFDVAQKQKNLFKGQLIIN